MGPLAPLLRVGHCCWCTEEGCPGSSFMLLAAMSLQTALQVNRKTKSPWYLLLCPSIHTIPAQAREDSRANPSKTTKPKLFLPCPSKAVGTQQPGEGTIPLAASPERTNLCLLGQTSSYCAHHGKHLDWSHGGQLRSEGRQAVSSFLISI